MWSMSVSNAFDRQRSDGFLYSPKTQNTYRWRKRKWTIARTLCQQHTLIVAQRESGPGCTNQSYSRRVPYAPLKARLTYDWSLLAPS